MKKQRSATKSLNDFLPDGGVTVPVQALVSANLKTEVQELLASDPRRLTMSDLITAAFKQYVALTKGK